MSKAYIEYLQHILLECNYITSVITADTRKEHFLEDETLKRAVVRSLEIIGEATKKNTCRYQADLESNCSEEHGWNAGSSHS